MGTSTNWLAVISLLQELQVIVMESGDLQKLGAFQVLQGCVMKAMVEEYGIG